MCRRKVAVALVSGCCAPAGCGAGGPCLPPTGSSLSAPSWLALALAGMPQSTAWSGPSTPTGKCHLCSTVRPPLGPCLSGVPKLAGNSPAGSAYMLRKLLCRHPGIKPVLKGRKFINAGNDSPRTARHSLLLAPPAGCVNMPSHTVHAVCCATNACSPACCPVQVLCALLQLLNAITAVR